MALASYDAGVFPDGRRLGAHLPLTTGMATAVERAHEIGASALQIFTDDPTAWRRRTELPAELPAFRSRLTELVVGPLTIHASYLVNLAGPEPDLYQRSIDLLARELESGPAFGAAMVNVHIGSHRDTSVAAGIDRLAGAIARILAEVEDGPDAARLVLENSVGGGFGIGTDLTELEAIAEAVAARGVPDRRVGFCVDTAHAWGAGIDISDTEAVDRFVAAFDAGIGLDRLAMIHLNDSRADPGSRLDRHEHLGAGQIGAPSLARFLTHPALVDVVYILETPGMDEGYDAVNIGRARDLAAGRPLAELPLGALDVRSSRSRIGPREAPGTEPAVEAPA
jgi:deoxyribonuclease IV